METQRQRKIGNLLQKELAEFFNRMARESTLRGILISVTKVRMTTDLSIAKVYLSVFPSKMAQQVLHDVNLSKAIIRHHISVEFKDQLRKIPELFYYIDDSLDYIENIEGALAGKDNPIEDPDLLNRRKKV